MSLCRALTPQTTAVWLQPQCYNWQSVLHVAEKDSQLEPTQPNNTNSSGIMLRLQQASQLLICNCGAALVLWEADPAVYSAGHQRQPLAHYTCTRGVSNHSSREDTYCTIIGLDTELNTSIVRWQGNKYLFLYTALRVEKQLKINGVTGTASC